MELGFKEKFLAMFAERGFNFLTVKQIIKKLNCKGFEAEQIANTCNQLVQEAELVCANGKLCLPQKLGARKGKIEGNPRGFAFLLGEDKQEDWFIHHKNLNGAMHGDTVFAKKEGSGDAYVVSVVSRGFTKIVGTFEGQSGYGFVIPDDKRYFADIFIPATHRKGAKHGQKVVALITEYPHDSNPQGTIIEILGYEGNKGVDILCIARAFGLYEQFESEVLEEAKRVPQAVQESELVGRKDFRHLPIITIDGSDARDLDDAVYVKKLANAYELHVHIADVAHYVKQGSNLDKEAFKRGTSVYFPEFVLPMLPKELSNGICSLHPHTDKLCLSCIMTIDFQGKLLAHDICESVICSKYRMTYEDVQGILEGEQALCQSYSQIVDMLKDMQELAHILGKKRQKRGAIDFDLQESKIVLDENGRVADVCEYPRLFSHRIIEEFMLAANETVAEQFSFLEVPFIYRIHERPSPEKIDNLQLFLDALGLSLKSKGNILPKTMQKLLQDTQKLDFADTLNKIVLRSMAKARYSPDNEGHFGLAAEYYSHFTSPIRRYPDLAIHRIIKYFLHSGTENINRFDQFVYEAADNSSRRERMAEEAEREVDNLKKTEYMSYHIGETFSGRVCGVSDFGVFVMLDNTIEGLVRVESLPKDDYLYDHIHMCLRGKKHIFKIGTAMNVVVYKTDLGLRKIEFVLA